MLSSYAINVYILRLFFEIPPHFGFINFHKLPVLLRVGLLAKANWIFQRLPYILYAVQLLYYKFKHYKVKNPTSNIFCCIYQVHSVGSIYICLLAGLGLIFNRIRTGNWRDGGVQSLITNPCAQSKSNPITVLKAKGGSGYVGPHTCSHGTRRSKVGSLML